MGTRLLISYVMALLLSLSSVVHADEITLPYKGITLNANLVLAAGKQLPDGAILITHGGLAHWGMEMIVYLQELLKERGYTTLAINLSLGLDQRHGMYDCAVTHRHLNTDAADEIGAWVTWLKTQGTRRIALLGHSRGGAQTALYAAEHDSEVIRAVLLMAPALRATSDAATYQQRFNSPLAPVLAKAQALIKSGKGNEVMQHVNLMNCADTPATAAAFVSYYGPQARVDSAELIVRFKKPTLVVVASNDAVVIDLDKKAAPLADGKRVQMKVIAGADHTFRDLYSDEAVEAMDGFLKGIGY